MKNLRKEIREGVFRQLYLLTGPEDYLRRQYRDLLRDALIPKASPGAEMNLHYYQGNEASAGALIDLAETMPFFGDRRLFILEDTELFKKGSDALSDYLSAPAPTACFMFVEKSADKRTKLYKLLKAKGLVAEFSTPDKQTLARWCGKLAAERGISFGEGALSLLLDYAGFDMNHLKNELDKLMAYAMDKGSIGEADVRSLCIRNPEDTVFQMIDSVADKNKERTMRLYEDLLKRREAPMKLLLLLARQYRILLGVIEKNGKGDRELAEALGIPVFSVKKYAALGAKLSRRSVTLGLAKCAAMDEAVKLGRIQDSFAFETLLLELMAPEEEEIIPEED